MSERQPITQYIPEAQRTTVDVQTYLAPVVERIAEVLPVDTIWQWYASSPQETGGRIMFPYFRVDNTLAALNIRGYLMRKPGRSAEQVAEDYQAACEYAYSTVVWVEIGFEGLSNLAQSPASRNWTGNVGHEVTDEERAAGIITEGARYYRDRLSDFADLRTDMGVTDDLFTQFGLEDTLYGIKTTKARKELAELGVSSKFVAETIDVLSKVSSYEGLRNEFGQRNWYCGEEQFLMPIIRPVYLADAKFREQLIHKISIQTDVPREVAHEYMSDMGNDPSLVFAFRYEDKLSREAVDRFIATAPTIVFDSTRNYLGLNRPKRNNEMSFEPNQG